MDSVILPEHLWKVADVARFLRCSTSYVYKAVERGELPVIRFGAMVRFNPEAIRTFVQGQVAPVASVVPLRRERLDGRERSGDQ